MHAPPKWSLRCAGAVLALALAAAAGLAWAGWDAGKSTFRYTPGGNVDETLGQIALYLLDQDKQQGNAYVSPDAESGIVGYQVRFFDNGNRVIDEKDWLSVRRYRIPATPDSTLPEGYYKNTFIELVDRGLDGVGPEDCYFLDGRRHDLASEPDSILSQYQTQLERAVTTFIRKVGYQTLRQSMGTAGQAAIKKERAFEDGSLAARMVLGQELRYVFRPIERNGTRASEQETMQEIRQQVGFIYSATMGYTDLGGYRFRDIADQAPLIQRTYDEMEAPVIRLIVEALFDTDGDGVIQPENLKTGYDRFRAIHQELVDNARGMNRRIVLPSEKLQRLRKEYETVHNKPFSP